MLRWTTALLLPLLLMSACGGYKPVELSMDDPNLLSGHWSGTLVQRRDMQTLFSNPDRVYLIDGTLLEVYDVHSGERLQTLPLPWTSRYSRTAYRDDGVIVVIGEKNLLMYDAQSLSLVSQRPLPDKDRYDTWRLSQDGSVLSLDSNGDRRFSTFTGASLQTAPSANAHFQANASSDDRWWIKTVPGATTNTQQIVASETGAAFDASSQHPQVTDCHPSADRGVGGVESVHVSEGGGSVPGAERLLIAYPDGILEIRDAAGHLLSTATLTSCQSFGMYRVPGQAALVAFISDTQSGLFDVRTGTVTERTSTSGYRTVLLSGSLSLAPQKYGLTENEYFSADSQPQYSFTPWNAPAWKLPNRTSTLSLDVSTHWTDEKSGTVTGTAQVDGRTLTVSGSLTSMDVKLKAQMRAFQPSLTASLTLEDKDGAVSFLSLTNGLQVTSVSPPAYDHSIAPHYTMSWSDDQDAQMIGLLRRP